MSNSNNNSDINNELWPKGSTWLLHVPPGWIYIGTVDRIVGDYLVLSDGVHLDGVANEHAMSDVAHAKTPAEQTAVCTRFWPLPTGHRIRLDCITQSTPCAHSAKDMARGRDADTIKKVR